jgi:hypothetical protein
MLIHQHLDEKSENYQSSGTVFPIFTSNEAIA